IDSDALRLCVFNDCFSGSKNRRCIVLYLIRISCPVFKERQHHTGASFSCEPSSQAFLGYRWSASFVKLSQLPQHSYIITRPQELVNDFFELFIHSIR
ncbi:hypothetical protein, partial [uncultured Faecalibaculum sp.]|uniref:hypothetical protein n=3 Tax=uncultured Faecalibaculum sp. TaxID=1729681 RepID=UPI00261121CC